MSKIQIAKTSFCYVEMVLDKKTKKVKWAENVGGISEIVEVTLPKKDVAPWVQTRLRNFYAKIEESEK